MISRFIDVEIHFKAQRFIPSICSDNRGRDIEGG